MAISLKCPTSHPPLNESTAPPPDERPVGSTDGAFFVSGAWTSAGVRFDARGIRGDQSTTYAANAAAIAHGR